MKPLLKWAGGKRHIADELIGLFPKKWNEATYFEPFIGGAAIFMHAQPMNAQISDLNKKLINFYVQIKEKPEQIFAQISEVSEKFNSLTTNLKKEYYLQIRSDFNESDIYDDVSATYFYVLNKLCFNGLYRENSKGNFNVPFGQKKKFPEVNKNDFIEASEILRHANILCADFESSLQIAKKDDFVYLDPPYVPVDATSNFTSYHSDGFSLKDQERLSNLISKMSDIGVNVLCSNSDTEVTREIFKQHNIQTIQAPRMVSAKSSGRGMITELVITNY